MTTSKRSTKISVGFPRVMNSPTSDSSPGCREKGASSTWYPCPAGGGEGGVAGFQTSWGTASSPGTVPILGAPALTQTVISSTFFRSRAGRFWGMKSPSPGMRGPWSFRRRKLSSRELGLILWSPLEAATMLSGAMPTMPPKEDLQSRIRLPFCDWGLWQLEVAQEMSKIWTWIRSYVPSSPVWKALGTVTGLMARSRAWFDLSRSPVVSITW